MTEKDINSKDLWPWDLLRHSQADFPDRMLGLLFTLIFGVFAAIGLGAVGVILYGVYLLAMAIPVVVVSILIAIAAFFAICGYYHLKTASKR